MTKQEHRKALEEFFEFGSKIWPLMQGNIYEAVYAVSEAHLWPDCVDSLSADQAIMCWAIVEKLREERFPKHLSV